MRTLWILRLADVIYRFQWNKTYGLSHLWFNKGRINLQFCECGELMRESGWRFLDVEGIFCSKCARQISFELMRTKVGRLIRVKVGDRHNRPMCPECGRFLSKNGNCNIHGLHEIPSRLI